MSRTRPTYFYAIISVALVLFIVGFFMLTTIHARKLATLFKEKVDIWLELKPDLGQEEIARIVGNIRQKPFVKPETITFISREQATATMKEDLGDESMLEDAPDLLRDVVRFNVRAEFMNDETMRQWREELRQDTLVSELYYEASNIGNVGKNIQNMGLIALGLVFLLIFAAVTLIHNTIRLALYSNRFIIKNQELVGASWTFISRPYIRRGVLNGLWSALLAIGALILVFEWIERQIPEMGQLRDLDSMLMVFTGIILLGVLISGLSTWFVVNKFLRMRIDDLY
jgi:cell division transport system permease protein